jgi:hypothetical protein
VWPNRDEVDSLVGRTTTDGDASRIQAVALQVKPVASIQSPDASPSGPAKEAAQLQQ